MKEQDKSSHASRQSSVVHGDQIKTGDISNVQTLNIGSGKQVIVNRHGSDATDLAAKFLEIYQQIDRRHVDADVEKDEIARTVKDIEIEAGKGQPNTRKIERWLSSLAKIAPDVLPVVAATLIDPSLGVTTAVCKIAHKILDRTDCV